MQLENRLANRTAQKGAGQPTQAGVATSQAAPAARQHRKGATLALLCGLLGVVFLGSLLLGHYPLAPDTVLAILAAQVLDIPYSQNIQTH